MDRGALVSPVCVERASLRRSFGERASPGSGTSAAAAAGSGAAGSGAAASSAAVSSAAVSSTTSAGTCSAGSSAAVSGVCPSFKFCSFSVIPSLPADLRLDVNAALACHRECARQVRLRLLQPGRVLELASRVLEAQVEQLLARVVREL